MIGPFLPEGPKKSWPKPIKVIQISRHYLHGVAMDLYPIGPEGVTSTTGATMVIQPARPFVNLLYCDHLIDLSVLQSLH